MYCLDCKCVCLEGETCPKCGKPLPGSEPLPRVEFKGPGLKKITLGYRCGDVTREALSAYLDRQETAVWATYEETDESQFSSDVYAELREELEAGRRGLLLFARALELVREWMGTGNNQTLKAAETLTAQSDQCVNDAMAMNYETNKNHMAAMQEYLRLMASRV
jgi:hypothetical protein